MISPGSEKTEENLPHKISLLIQVNTIFLKYNIKIPIMSPSQISPPENKPPKSQTQNNILPIILVFKAVFLVKCNPF